MWWHNGTPEQDHLNAYWDAMVGGAAPDASAQAAPDLDPNLLDTVTRARLLHRRNRPDPAFALQLETTLMNAFATTYPKSTVIQPVPPKRLVTRPIWLPQREEIFPRRWSLAAVATVALIAIMLVVFFFNLRNTSQPAHVPGTPAAATPTSTPAPTATAEPVSMYRGNPARTGVLPGPSLTGAPVELWKLQTGEPVNLGAAVVDGVLYLSGGSQGFEARDAMTGDLIWTFPTDASAVSAPAVVDGQGYVIDTDGTLYAVRTSDGSEAWRMANVNVRSSVAPVDGLVYVVSPEGTSYALDAATGAIAWQADTGAEAAGGMAVAAGIVYQGNAAGVMSAFDAKTGELRWTFQNEEGRGSATVTAANGQLYVTISGGDTNAIYAIDAASGELTWRQEQGPGQGFISVTATPTRLYSVSEDGVLHALNAKTGETVWTYQLLEFVRSIPVLVDDTLYVADNGGFVRAIDPDTGNPLWEYPIAGEVDLGWPVVSNGVLYIGTSFGNFYAITGSDMISAPSILTPTPAATPAAVGDGALPAASPSGASGVARIVWESDDAEALLSHASGVAEAPDGTIWVSDGANSRFQIFDPDGALLDVWGEKGSGEGQFNFVNTTYGDGLGAVAFAPDGSFYVADTGNYRIQHFSADGELLAVLGSFGTENGQFINPSSIAVDSEGNVMVSDDFREDVQKFDAAGNWLATMGGSGSGPGQLDHQGYVSIGPDDTIWVADPENKRIHHFATDGTLIADLDFAAILGEPTWVQSLAIDADGRLYLADIDGKRLFVLGSDGTELGIWSLLRADGSANPNSGGLVVTAAGAVYLADWLDGTLYRYELDPPLVPSGDAAPRDSAPLGHTRSR
jgi:outer membrane protein assembly factor BamB